MTGSLPILGLIAPKMETRRIHKAVALHCRIPHSETDLMIGNPRLLILLSITMSEQL
jgi:hypothetical protein